MNDKKSTLLSGEVKKEIEARVQAFNDTFLRKKRQKYVPRFKGSFVYLMRKHNDDQELEHVCRLTYNGVIDDLSFAIYKCSSE